MGGYKFTRAVKVIECGGTKDGLFRLEFEAADPELIRELASHLYETVLITVEKRRDPVSE